MDEKEKLEFFGNDDEIEEKLDDDNMDMFMKNSKHFFKQNKEITEDPDEDKYNEDGSLKEESTFKQKAAGTAHPLRPKKLDSHRSKPEIMMNRTIQKMTKNPKNPYNINWQSKILRSQFGVRVKTAFVKSGVPQFKLVKSARTGRAKK